MPANEGRWRHDDQGPVPVEPAGEPGEGEVWARAEQNEPHGIAQQHQQRGSEPLKITE
jgi:hypothetical protein